jgi:hypothetical protein
MLVNAAVLPTPFVVTQLPDIPKQGTSRRKAVAHIVLHTTGGYPDSKPEVCFARAEDAEASGFRAAKR